MEHYFLFYGALFSILNFFGSEGDVKIISDWKELFSLLLF